MVHKHEKGSGSVAKRLLGLCLALVMLCGVFVPTFASVAGVDQTQPQQETVGGTDEKQTGGEEDTNAGDNGAKKDDTGNVSGNDGNADAAKDGEGDANANGDGSTGEADNTVADVNAKYREMYDAIITCEDAEQLAQLLAAAEVDEGFTAWLETLSEEELAAFTEKTTPTATYATIDIRSVAIRDTVATDGHFTVVVSGPNGTTYTVDELIAAGYTISWSKLSTDGQTTDVVRKKVSGSSIYNMAPNGEWVDVAYDKGAQCTYTVTVSNATTGTSVSSNPLKVDYYDEIQNGSFETPVNSGSGAQKFYKNGTAGLIWKTTGTDPKGGDQDIEIVRTDTYDRSKESLQYHGIAKAAVGDQYAEINAEAWGALYQDVLTQPGSTMYWQLYHSARLKTGGSQSGADFRGTDTMYVIIMDTKTADQLVNRSDAQDYLKELAPMLASENAQKDSDAQNLYNSGARSFKCSSSEFNKWIFNNGQYKVPDGQYVTRYFFVSESTAKNSSTIGNQIDGVYFSATIPEPTWSSAIIRVKKQIYGLTMEQVENLPKDFITCDGKVIDLAEWKEAVDSNNQTYIYATGVKVISDIDSQQNYNYTFIESTDKVKVDGYNMTCDNSEQTVTVKGGSSADVVFTNTYTPANTTVTVSKQVTGLLGDTSKNFTFEWYYTKDGQTSSTQTFTLRHGQAPVVLENIPIGATVTVTEKDAADYTTSWSTKNGPGNGKTATLTVEANPTNSNVNTITFTNYKDANPDTGIFLDSMPYIMALVIVAGGAAVFFLRRRKKSED